MSECSEEFAPSDDPSSWLRANSEGGPVTVDGITVYSVHDMLSLPRRDYIVKGLFAPGEMSVIVGPPKSGKSFLAMHLG